jgi:hypothetical protein
MAVPPAKETGDQRGNLPFVMEGSRSTRPAVGAELGEKEHRLAVRQAPTAFMWSCRRAAPAFAWRMLPRVTRSPRRCRGRDREQRG